MNNQFPTLPTMPGFLAFPTVGGSFPSINQQQPAQVSQEQINDIINRYKAEEAAKMQGVGQNSQLMPALQQQINNVNQRYSTGLASGEFAGSGASMAGQQSQQPQQPQQPQQNQQPSFNNAAPSALGNFGRNLRDKSIDAISKYGGQVAGAGIGFGVGGPIGGVLGAGIGAEAGKDIANSIKYSINNPTNPNDPYAAYRTQSNNPQYDTQSGNEGMPMADQYASYGAGSRGQTNPNSNQNYSTPSGNEGMSVSQQYGSYGAGRQGDSGDSNDNSSDSGSDTSGGSY